MTEQDRDDRSPQERDAAIEDFWNVARFHGKLTQLPGYFGPTVLASVPPPVWSLGATPQEADAAVAGLLDGSGTTLRTPTAEYESAGEPLPEPGALAIVTDGQGRPRVLVVTSAVEVVDDEVVEELTVLHS
ncbi:hypothetical protein [Nocardioides solisilvae]|uniref:hypothetical protein n=1 Tax=Nocardioides solisilvae TaxID=1542435 RepID=UPI000D74C380|nr:hypothetical protein [Nocardioides solisilvae]